MYFLFCILLIEASETSSPFIYALSLFTCIYALSYTTHYFRLLTTK